MHAFVKANLDDKAKDLLCKLLIMDPGRRMNAGDALDHDWFWSDPMPCDPGLLPRYPSSHEFVTKKRRQENKGQPDPKRQQADSGQRPPGGGGAGGSHNHSSHQNGVQGKGGDRRHHAPDRERISGSRPDNNHRR